ncbi:MAG TPA: type VI secretion system accessory protein TagJ [Caulobacteraceae bacterium]|nr:type VI secretion system accessory protein TagJ [Caulobacteraceae bacterium]
MADADEFLRAGDVAGARSALVETIKASPQDQRARIYLFQLLCVMGDWDKARTHLRSLAQLSPEAQMLSVAYGQAIDAEIARAAAFAGQAPFHAAIVTSPWVEQLAQALTLEAQGRANEGAALREAAFEAAGDTPGEIDGQAFTWIADADARFGPTFEAIFQGRWGLIPFEAVSQIRTEGPLDLRDIVWLPAELELRSGQSVAVMLPARYPGTEAESDGDLRLGRSTEWRPSAIGDQGVGQRLWTLSGGEDVPLYSFRKLVMV